MITNNFNFLKDTWPELAKLGVEAELYTYSDPQSSLMKLRCFIELTIGIIYRDLNIYCNKSWNLLDKLRNKEFEKIINRTILDKFHAIRIKGNKAVHGENKIDFNETLWLIEEAYLIACWFYKSYNKVEDKICRPFIKPIDNGKRYNKLEKTIEELQNILEIEKRNNSQLKEINLKNEEIISSFKNSNNNVAEKMNINSDEINKRISLHEIFEEYSLTNSQISLIDKLNNFLNSKDINVFILKGYAGTGKTFITKGLTEYLSSVGKDYLLAAPTGKAAKVIKEKTGNSAFTIHKSIYKYENLKDYKIENFDGSETFKFYFELASNDHSDNTVYIIDESSMISDVEQNSEFLRFGTGNLLSDLFEYINLDHNDQNKKVILIGDSAQLPPVGMNFSPALDENYLKTEFNVSVDSFELTEIVRQEENSGILDNSLILRKSISENIFNQLDIKLDKKDIVHVEHSDLLSQYLESCNYSINGESIIIAHSNKVVDEYNSLIRKHFFQDEKFICPGDKVMSTVNNNRFGVFIYNGDFGLVRKVYPYLENDIQEVTLKHKFKIDESPVTIRVPLYFRKVEIGFKNEANKAHWFECYILENVLYPEIIYANCSLSQYKEKDLKSIEAKALYVNFVNRMREKDVKPNSEEFKQEIKNDIYFNSLKIKFGYALTCHKAQGSEWNNVFINCKTHESILSKGYFRWLYTAITRASKKLYTLDEPHIQLADFSEFDSSKVLSTHNSVLSDSISMLISKKVNDICLYLDMNIKEVAHHPWCELYSFEKDNKIDRIQIYYNGKNKITSIKSIENNTFEKLIELLKKELLDTIVLTKVDKSKFVFQEDFLESFYFSIKEKIEKHNISIININHINYCERYTFEKDSKVAIIDFWYNGKKQFKKAPQVQNNSSVELVKEILESL